MDKFAVLQALADLDQATPAFFRAEMFAHGDMTVRGEFESVDGGTEITLTHTGIPNDMICDVIQAGWTASTAQLVAVIEALTRMDETMETQT